MRSRILRRLAALTTTLAALAATAAVTVAVTATVPAGATAPAAPTTPVGLSSWCPTQASAVVLGDSSSTGYGTTGYSNTTETWQPTYSGWVASLGRLWPHSTWTVLSRNGAMSSDYLPGGRFSITVGAIDVIDDEQPALVVIMLGGNDYVIDADPVTTYRANLERITADIRAVSPQSSLLYVSIWEFAYRRQSPPPVHPYSAYIDQMRAVAQAHDAVHVDLTRDMHSAAVHPETGLYIRDEYGPGLAVHATDAGNWVVRAVMARALQCSESLS